MRKLLLLRPEPGLTARRERAEAMGVGGVACPLFDVGPLAGGAPDARQFEALLLTSANAVREAGPGLAAYRALPVHAVGQATAAAAEAAALRVQTTGSAGVDALLAGLSGTLRLLHLCGRHRAGSGSAARVTSIAVYESRQVDRPALPDMSDMVVAVHSPRAGRRLDELAQSRPKVRIAAISEAAAAACGTGWHSIAVASQPSDAELLALAAKLCQTGGA